ncbi:nucleoside triphosphate pyrophosphohydrolase [Streptomyces sp. NPDC094031]|uniref:nucleoside triphosphate pyrophosphohydrolase n=1 Tax=Streptomyces sp. NPDC094031 TaxID=3155307 RepID=UPI00331B0E81
MNGEVGKLVRDRIPQMIRDGGAEPVIHIASPDEYRAQLRDRLLEKVAEFLDADEASYAETLSDVREVVFALAADLGVDANQLEEIRAAKAADRGGFDERIIWMGNR